MHSIMGGLVNVHFPFQDYRTNRKAVSNIEEFASFLKENGAQVEFSFNRCMLTIGTKGCFRNGGRLLSRPDPTTEIYIYVQSNAENCDVNQLVPCRSRVIITAPNSTAEIPNSLLTENAIWEAYKIALRK